MPSHASKFGPVSNYRIPPESSGKRIQHFEHYYLEVQNLSNDFGFPATFATVSGVTGTIADYWTTGIGGQARLLVYLDNDNDNVDALVVAENVVITNTLVGATATLVSWTPVLTPALALVDHRDPSKSARIDDFGALSTRFTEGEPQFDAFGLIRTSTPHRLSDFTFTYSKLPADFQESVVGTASVSHLPNEGSVALDTDIGATDSVKFTSNLYHHYTPGASQIIVMTVAIGDTGKANVRRRWGYFDDNNGVFFELDGTDLYVVKRSSTSGVPVDTRLLQSQWSGDQLDGSGDQHNLSLMNLNISNVNIYWIDFQWLGAGRVRYGVYTPEGRRVTLHEFRHANNLTSPYMASAELPLRVEQSNSGVATSPSRMKLTCATVHTESPLSEDFKQNLVTTRSATLAPKAVADGAESVLAVFRVQSTFAGKTNRKKTIPKTLHYYVDGNSPVHIIIRFTSILAVSGGAWVQPHLDSPAEYNSTAAVLVPGTQVSQRFLSVGANQQAVTQDFNSQAYHLRTNANGVCEVVAVVSAISLNTGSSVNVTLGVDWMDL